MGGSGGANKRSPAGSPREAPKPRAHSGARSALPGHALAPPSAALAPARPAQPCHPLRTPSRPHTQAHLFICAIAFVTPFIACAICALDCSVERRSETACRWPRSLWNLRTCARWGGAERRRRASARRVARASARAPRAGEPRATALACARVRTRSLAMIRATSICPLFAIFLMSALSFPSCRSRLVRSRSRSRIERSIARLYSLRRSARARRRRAAIAM